MIKRLIIAVVVLGLVAVGIIGFEMFRSQAIKDFFAGNKPPATAVPIYDVRPRAWTPVVSAIGTAAAVQGVDLSVEDAGIVKEIGFSANDRIEAGQLLLRLDDAVQIADLNAARTQARLDEQALERTRALRERGVSSGVTLDEAQAQADSSFAQVAKLEAVLATKRLRAPFGGIIGIPAVDPGSYVSPGTVIATLQDVDQLHVDFKVPEQQFALLEIGQDVRVGPEEGSLSLKGEITGIDPKINPATRLVSVRAKVENGDPTLVPGQFVQVEVHLPRETGVLTVPQTALVTSLYGDHVFVVRPSEDDPEVFEARQVFVTAGRRSGGVVEIVKGLEPGNIVITAGQNRLSNGTVVKPDNSVSPEVDEVGQAEDDEVEGETRIDETPDGAEQGGGDTGAGADSDTEEPAGADAEEGDDLSEADREKSGAGADDADGDSETEADGESETGADPSEAVQE